MSSQQKQQQKSSWFKGIKGKLLFAAVLPFFGFGALYFTAMQGFQKASEIIGEAHNSMIPNLNSVGSLRYNRARFGYRAVQAANEPVQSPRYADFLNDTKAAAEDFEKHYKTYLEHPVLTDEVPLQKIGLPAMEATITTMKEIVKLLEAKDPAKAEQAEDMLSGEFMREGEVAQKFMNDVMYLYRDYAKNQGIVSEEARRVAEMVMLSVSVISGFIIFGILFWLAHKVSSEVGSISQRLAGAARDVASSVEQLNEAGNTLSSSSTEAAASLEETVASLEEMTSMVKMGSDNAKQAAALATSSCQAAESGAHDIENLIRAMSDISVSSKKIEEIISVIDDIAFQTNLLALNAAVEAARAGEQGKGFAVVAEAVRTLAQRSAASAKDIASLIKESVSQVENGSEIADRSGATLSNILQSIKKVSDLNNEIATASQEQATGIEQINKAMSQLDQASQSNAASAEEIAATAGEISNLAIATQGMTEELNKVVLGVDDKVGEASAMTHSKNVTVPAKKTVAKVGKSAGHAIPFDEDSRGNVGDVSGF